MFFDIFYDLCQRKGVSCKKAAEEIGLSNSITTKWKKTGAIPGGETLHRIAAYFGVSTDYLLGKESTPTLTEKDRRDIARDLEDIMAHLETSGDLMFYGDPMSDEARESIRAAMKLGLEAAQVKNKERFTPKKYRKG